MKSEESLFADALALPAAERVGFLARACGDDEALRERLTALLRGYDEAGAALEVSPVAQSAVSAQTSLADASPDYAPGTWIGRYKLLQKIGEGGCGVIFMAEQTEPVRRRVAVKIIKLGMDTKEVIARFEAERQALALMDHPNIAHVLDAGATDRGRPFFVMDLVRGIPITRHCDEHQIGADGRLRLFIQVCQAVQHAHQKGIIHRDLKPSNILVTMHDGVPVPKIIDFGIAKAMHGRLTDRTLFTAFEQFIGTPAYMSPEQTEMSGLDVDTRSDIYSLGVLLYELLAGRTPFGAQELVRVGLDEMRRIIRQDEPPKPSTRLVTLDAADRAAVARHRGTDVPQLSTLLRGDLDWIVMRAIEKDRSRRYETASNLAADIEHHLRNEPVAARPPSPAYLMQRLVRRNKLAFAAAAGIIAALGLGLTFAMLGLRREQTARLQADTEARRSAQVARFMQDMLAGVGPQVALGRDTKLLRSILDETVERLNRELHGQPEVEAGLRATLGTVYRDLGEYRSATLMHETALQIRRQTFGAEHPAVADSLSQLGEALARQDRLAEAEARLREALALREKFLDSGHASVAETRAALNNVLRQAGKPPDANGAGSKPPRAAGMQAEGKPAVIRIAHTGGRSTGETFNSGTILSTAGQMHVLENEFNADGIRIQWLYFPGGAATIEASVQGRVDFAYLGIIGRAAGLDQKILLRAGGNGGGLNYLVVRADASFGNLADLKGRKLGTVRSTSGHLALLRILEKHGFRQEDFTITFYDGAAALAAALLAGEVDGYYMSRPFRAVAQGAVKVIHDASGEVPVETAAALLVSGDFERRYPAVVQRVVNAVVKLAAWNSDEKNRDEIFAVWTRAGRDRDEMEKSWAAMPLKERYSPLLDDYFLARQRRSLDDYKRFGLISSDVNLDGWAEPKYLRRALVELGLEDFWPERDAEGKPKAAPDL